jgi:hypothetical protein
VANGTHPGRTTFALTADDHARRFAVSTGTNCVTSECVCRLYSPPSVDDYLTMLRTPPTQLREPAFDLRPYALVVADIRGRGRAHPRPGD